MNGLHWGRGVGRSWQRFNTSLFITSYIALLGMDMFIDVDRSQTAQQRRLLIAFVCEVKWVYHSKAMLFTANGRNRVLDNQ